MDAKTKSLISAMKKTIIEDLMSIQSAICEISESHDDIVNMGEDTYADTFAEKYPFEKSIDEYILSLGCYIEHLEEDATANYTEIETVYSEKSDMTFIMEVNYINGERASETCIGLYFGKPNDKDTEQFAGRLTCKYAV